MALPIYSAPQQAALEAYAAAMQEHVDAHAAFEKSKLDESAALKHQADSQARVTRAFNALQQKQSAFLATLVAAPS